MTTLSVREMQIIKHTANGLKAKEVAKILDLEYRTVEIYVSRIRKKLQAKNTVHAVVIALQERLLPEYVNE